MGCHNTIYDVFDVLSGLFMSEMKQSEQSTTTHLLGFDRDRYNYHRTHNAKPRPACLRCLAGGDTSLDKIVDVWGFSVKMMKNSKGDTRTYHSLRFAAVIISIVIKSSRRQR